MLRSVATSPRSSPRAPAGTRKSSAMMPERPLRIAHLADTHIGMENFGRINPETGLNQRLHDFLDSLDQALDAALEAQVDVVAFAGDIYKTRDPTPTHQREFARRVQRLSAAGVHT